MHSFSEGRLGGYTFKACKRDGSSSSREVEEVVVPAMVVEVVVLSVLAGSGTRLFLKRYLTHPRLSEVTVVELGESEFFGGRRRTWSKKHGMGRRSLEGLWQRSSYTVRRRSGLP